MKLKLLSAFCVFFISYHAQTNTDLKGLINKNSIAIHSIQKHLMSQLNSEYITTFRLLLQNQESAVKTFKINESNSAYFAMLVRKECLNFLKKTSNNSLSYFAITENERNLPLIKNETSFLSEEDLKTIENLDLFNPQQLKNLTLTVQ